jgi:nicotinate-nucleotide adenylyltransferase
MSPRSIAIFGGSFNPIHLGHLAVAEEVRIRYNMERVIFVPAHQSPNKETEELVDVKKRLVMAHLAVVSNPFFEVSDFEAEREGQSYSIDTIRHFKSVFGEDVTLYFILGADCLMELATWRDIQDALRLCRFIAVTRPGYEFGKAVRDRLAVAPGPGLDAVSLENILLEECVKIDVSSTLVRQRVQERKSIKYLVPEPVEQFIRHNGLYV